MRILTNFMNSPEFIDYPAGGRAEVVRREVWSEVRGLLSAVDLIVVDCRDVLLYRIAAHFLLFPWKHKPLVAVDLVLRRPQGLRQWATTRVRRLLFKRVDHFIHYFRDITGYTRYFGISQRRSSYVPFKVNNRDSALVSTDIREDYVFTMGRSLRDYDTYIRAVAELPYPAAIPEFSFDDFEGKDPSFIWTRKNVPQNLSVLPDTGSRADLVKNLAKARVVVIPTQASSLCASGLSTYLDAMHLGKCVIMSHGPGASDLLTDQAILVPPQDVGALKAAITRAWQDDALRGRVAAAGRTYALSVGGEPELLQRIFRQALTALAQKARQ
jgi:glycosyltransferase involved in cell wall biosynthesis